MVSPIIALGLSFSLCRMESGFASAFDQSLVFLVWVSSCVPKYQFKDKIIWSRVLRVVYFQTPYVATRITSEGRKRKRTCHRESVKARDGTKSALRWMRHPLCLKIQQFSPRRYFIKSPSWLHYLIYKAAHYFHLRMQIPSERGGFILEPIIPALPAWAL